MTQGKRKDQYEKSASVAGWSIVALFFLLVVIFTAKDCHGQKPGWLVVIETENKTTIKRFTDEADVLRVVSLYFPGLEKNISGQKFFEVRTEKVTIYVERKRVVETRRGKLKFRKEKR